MSGDGNELPLVERCEAVAWKVRLGAYEELAGHLVSTSPRDEDEMVRQLTKTHLSLVHKYVADPNVAAQEKGVNAALLLLQHAPPRSIADCADDILRSITARCFTSSKPAIRLGGISLATQLVAAGLGGKVVASLGGVATGGKGVPPKVATLAVQALRECVGKHGVGEALPSSSLLPLLPKLLEGKDGGVREQGKELAKSIYRLLWQPRLEQTAPATDAPKFLYSSPSYFYSLSPTPRRLQLSMLTFSLRKEMVLRIGRNQLIP